MRVAEALNQRAGLQKRIESLKSRITRNAKVQEGETPGEDPSALIADFEAAATELQRLIQRINSTNSVTRIGNGLTMSEAIAVRDILKLKHGVYRDLATAASITQDRATRSEVKFKSTINISEIQKHADDLARQYRELDATIQEANWSTDLINRPDRSELGQVVRLATGEHDPAGGLSRHGQREGPRLGVQLSHLLSTPSKLTGATGTAHRVRPSC